VAKPILEKKSYEFVTKLMDEISEYQEMGGKKANPTVEPAHIPKNIATTERPPKEDVIRWHMSRMLKKKKEEKG